VIRDRIKELRRVKASELVPNPKNWRKHPQAQRDALRGVLDEVGYADAVLVRELDDGRLMLVDGHLRTESTPEADVPVLILDVNEEEADKLLATLDPLAAMATTDAVQLEYLLASVKTSDEALAQMLTSLLDQTGKAEPAEKDAATLCNLTVDGYEPRHTVLPGQVWDLSGRHLLIIADVFNEWPMIFDRLTKAPPDTMFVPYAGPLVPLSVAAKLRPLVMVQPVEFVAATLLDWWDDAHGEGEAKLA
jgi:hypothetical protein